MYCAIIMDLVNSRNIENRYEFQQELEKTLDSLNNKYIGFIESALTLTLGDEVQGLLNTPEPVMNLYQEIQNSVFPYRLRLGIGFGEINTRIRKDKSIGADGPAYHMARKAIKEIAENEGKYEAGFKKIGFCYENRDKTEVSELINSALSL